MASDSPLERRRKLDIMQAEMELKAQEFHTYWDDIARLTLPRRIRLDITDANKGDRRNLSIIDATASLAARTLSSGMMTGVTSPARAWFKLKTSNEDLNGSPAVKEYFTTIEKRMRDAMLRTNLYNQLPVLYGDLGAFATAAVYMEEDSEDVANFTTFPIGSYTIANDKKGRVRTFYREFQMSVRQIVEKFGMNKMRPGVIDWTNISEFVKSQYEVGQKESMVDVCHFIQPNDRYNRRAVESKFKRFESLYYEKGGSSQNSGLPASNSVPDKFLREMGYDYFPVMVVRWEVAGEDTWGTNSPGMMSLGDNKQLQHAEKRIAQALDQKVNPSMVGPTSLKTTRSSMIPGDITYLDRKSVV